MGTASGRFSLRPLLSRHVQSLQDASTGRISFGTWWALVGIPLLLGGLAGYFIQPLSPAGSLAPSPALPLTASGGALTGGFLACFVLLTNLRIKLAESPHLPQTPDTRRSLSFAAINSLYLTTASASFLVIALGLGAFWSQVATTPIAAQIWFGAAIALLAHILVLASTLIRRASSAYITMFGADTAPVLRAVPDRNRHVS